MENTVWFYCLNCWNSILTCHSNSMLANHSRGQPNGSLSIATTPRCKGRHHSFTWIASLTFDPYLIILSVKQRGIKNHFLSLWCNSTRDWTPVPWTITNTLTIMAMSWYNFITTDSNSSSIKQIHILNNYLC